ncbi:calcium proton exchanger protein [Rutstroemia sp. NJR-2017a WRK4]|nr:calcium proton exchanger protein [Rutstroemia sp. NJR-2017a WRK4]
MAGYLHPSSAGQKISTTREPLRRSISISFSTRQDESKKPLLKDETTPQRYSRDNLIPTHDINHLGFRVTTGIAPDGESGRTGINPIRFISICWKSSSGASQAVNFLWPIVPVAIMVTYTQKDYHTAIFVLNYLSMIPSANLIGFAGQELSRKLDKVFGILLETTLGSVVEIVMFIVLLMRHEYQVIQAAILGSILATQLLCLGMCFFIGGLSHDEQVFDEEISEVGSDLLLQAGLGLIVPAAFHTAVRNSGAIEDPEILADKVLHISRMTSILLVVSYMMYVYFQMRSHQSIYDAIFEADEQQQDDYEEDLVKDKLTFTECVVALIIAIAMVTFTAIRLTESIAFIVEERGIADSFVGLILVPLVEKFAEHLTAIDEAYDNSMNLALSHVLGATIQTALFNAPLVVLIGWCLDIPMDLNFDLFNIVILILSILVVGNFLKDCRSNYLEGFLCVLIYVNIAVAAYYYPNPPKE